MQEMLVFFKIIKLIFNQKNLILKYRTSIQNKEKIFVD